MNPIMDIDLNTHMLLSATLMYGHQLFDKSTAVESKAAANLIA